MTPSAPLADHPDEMTPPPRCFGILPREAPGRVRGGRRSMVARPRGKTGQAGSRLRAVAGSAVRGRELTIRSDDDSLPQAVEVEEPAPRTLLLRVRGAFGEGVGLELGRILDDRLGAPGVARVVIDLVGVATLTSAGVSILHRLHRECRVTGRHLVLVGTANPAVHRYLYLSGLPRSSTGDRRFRQRSVSARPPTCPPDEAAQSTVVLRSVTPRLALHG